MKSLHLLLIIFTIILTSCGSHQNHDEDACIDHFLNEFNMKPYEGEDLACKTHIRLYQFEDVYFAYKNNHCADFAPFIIYDCAGEEFCSTSTSPCHLEESEDLGIIGIEE